MIDALPVFDSRISARAVEDGAYRSAEQALEGLTLRLAQERTLEEAVATPVDLGGKTTTLREYAAESRRYQIASGGELWNKSRARRGEIPAIPGHAQLRKAFLDAADFSKQDEAPPAYLRMLAPKPGAAHLFAGPTRVFDIGFHDGKVSASVAQTLIGAGVAPENIVYHGMDLLPQLAEGAAEALRRAGVPAENIDLKGGKLGFADAQLHGGGVNHALALENTAGEDKYHLVLALNLYNFGDQDRFWRQVDGCQRDNAALIAMHDASGDLLDCKASINREAEGLLRVASPVSQALEARIRDDRRSFSRFAVPYTIRFPDMPESAWERLRQSPAGVFDRPYEQDAPHGVKPAEYARFRELVEFCLGEPMGSFTQAERDLALSRLHEKVEARQGLLTGTLETQIVLSREHSVELEQAAEAAARECARQLAPMQENLPRGGAASGQARI